MTNGTWQKKKNSVIEAVRFKFRIIGNSKAADRPARKNRAIIRGTAYCLTNGPGGTLISNRFTVTATTRALRANSILPRFAQLLNIVAASRLRVFILYLIGRSGASI